MCRVLFEHQQYTANHVRGNSMYNAYRALVRGHRRLGNKMVAHIALPDRTRHSDGIVWNPREVLEDGFEYSESSAASDPYLPKETLSPYYPDFYALVRDKNFVLDFVVTSRYAHILSLLAARYKGVSAWNIETPLPIVNYCMETALDPSMPVLRRDEVAAQIVMAAAMVPTLVPSQADATTLFEYGAKFLSGATRCNLHKNVKVVPFGFDAAYLDEHREDYDVIRRGRASKVVIFHGGSAGESKRHVNDLIALVKAARPLMGKIDLQVLLVSQGVNTYEESFVTTINNVNGQEEYFKTFAQGDFLWMASEYEGTGIGYMEAIRSGMLPICYDKPIWIGDRVPISYPARLKTLDVDKSAPILAAICKARVALKEKFGDSVIRHLDAWQDTSVAVQWKNAIGALVKPLIDANIEVVRKSLPYKILQDNRHKLPNSMTIEECFSLMQSLSRNNINFKWAGARVVRLALLDLGYHDQMDSLITMER